VRSTTRRTAVRKLGDDQGNVLISVVLVSMLIGMLTSLTLATANHADRSSTSDRNHEIALSVAEAGVHEAVAELSAQISTGTFPGSFDPPQQSTPQGDYNYQVFRCVGAVTDPTECGAMGVTSGYVIDSTATVGHPQLGRPRHVRAAVEPAELFPGEDGPYTLFSYQNIELKGGDTIKAGDVWANDSISLDQNNKIYGNVISATSWIQGAKNGTEIFGEVWSGGYHCEHENPSDPASACRADELWAIDMSGGVVVHGNARASTFLPCASAPTTPHFDIKGGTIEGTATTLGSVTSNVAGTIRTNTCTPAAPKKEMPPFIYDPANYDPSTLQVFSSAAAFNTWSRNTAGSARVGTFVINEPAPSQTNRVELCENPSCSQGWNIGGDVTIITNAPIFGEEIYDTAVPANSKAKLVLVSHYEPPSNTSNQCANTGSQHATSECAIHYKNHFSSDCKTAVLLYADKGIVSMKNNAEMCGSFISNGIQMMNGLALNYDSRLDRLPGFGPTVYEISRWEELPS
jgi:hypothetical protein